jgi:hypothetical protein
LDEPTAVGEFVGQQVDVAGASRGEGEQGGVRGGDDVDPGYAAHSPRDVQAGLAGRAGERGIPLVAEHPGDRPGGGHGPPDLVDWAVVLSMV